MLGVLKRKWKPKRAPSSNGHHHNNNQNGRLLEAPAPTSVDVRAAPSARQIHPVYGEKAQLLAYENEQDALLQHHLHHAAAAAARNHSPPPVPPPVPPPAPPYLAIPPPPLPPAYPLSPNICVEGGRIEFIRPPLDGAEDKTSPDHPYPHQAPAIPPVGALGSLGARGSGHRRAGSIAGSVSRAQQTLPPGEDTHSEEKCDLAKECLEARVSELEALLESERRCCARERSAVQRLQRQLAKREAARRDVDRERRLDSAAEAEQCKARLAALQRDLARMEEALRCMLQYKTRCSQLKQDKAALAAAYEARIQQYQTTIGKLSQENETLKKQVKGLEAQGQGGGAVQEALLQRLRALESDNRLLSTDVEQQRRQYERCLDDVANQVVRALLSQKGLREEIGALHQRIRELEHQNRALTSLLVQQLQSGEQDFKQITAGEVTSADLVQQAVPDDMVTLSKPRLRRPAGRHRPSPTCGPPCGGTLNGQLADDQAAAIMAAVASIDPTLWLQVARPQSLPLFPSLEGAQEMVSVSLRDDSIWQQDGKLVVAGGGEAAGVALTEDVVEAAVAVGDEDQAGSSSPESSPESGNRDEGYSTMSSDVQVQVEASHASSRLAGAGESASASGLGPCTELEDVKEEAEQVVVEVAAVTEVVSSTLPTAGAGRLLLLELQDLQALSARHSFPPARDPQFEAALRNSFSDSHLCLSRLLHHAAAASFASTPASCPAATSHKPVLFVDLGFGDAGKQHPLRRARATPSLLPPLQLVAEELAEHGDEEDLMASDWWDADYVQHWLRLDETRSALQQRHREAYELEYDQAELEDWSLSLSSEDLDLSWRRVGHQGLRPAPPPPPAPPADPPTPLPSIQENNSVELEEDACECLWNDASYLEASGAGDGGVGGCSNGGGLGATGAAGSATGWPYALQLPDAMMSSLAVNAAGSSPGGSWSSSAAASASDCYDCCLNGCHGEEGEGSSKRSSAALSGCSDESAATSGATSAASRDRESPSAVGTDFTRDFYRLVKFESTKSLASNSSSRNSRSQPGDNINNNLPTSMDREQALQSVLKFIAEQQKYCHSREEQDSATELGSRPVSYTYSLDEENQEPPSTACTLSGAQTLMEQVEEEFSRILRIQKEAQDNSTTECVAERQEVSSLSDSVSVSPTAAAATTAVLETVPEDEELGTTHEGAMESTSTSSVPSVLVCDANDKAVSFHENASSKDVIDELNRMIRKGEGEGEGEVGTPGTLPRPKVDRTATEVAGALSAASSADGSALTSCPTGWVHVERDIDFTDPKARANLLDVMLASSGSSASMSSSGSEDGDGEDLPADYQHLHRLHRFRRHKKASAFRDPFGVLRFSSFNIRPSIIGRDDFFVRYGEKEREAIASFDFLDDMSAASRSSSAHKLDREVHGDTDDRTGLCDSYGGSRSSLEQLEQLEQSVA